MKTFALALCALSIACIAPSAAAQAQSYPNRPIRLKFPRAPSKFSHM